VWVADPVAMISSAIRFAWLIGIAKPMPMFPASPSAAVEAIAVLMPMTCPAMSVSGPPELPGLMAADREHGIADRDLVGIGQDHRGMVAVFDLEDRHVRVGVGTDDLGGGDAAVAEQDLEALGGFRAAADDHVVVGHDVAVVGDDEARTVPAVGGEDRDDRGHDLLDDSRDRREVAVGLRIGAGDGAAA